MSLLLSHLKTYDSNTRNVQTNKQVNTTSSASKIANTKELIKGEVLKGEIIDLRNNQAAIRMSDGSIIQGRMEQDVDLYIGQKASFEVVKNNEAGVQLKIVPEQVKDSNDSLAGKALLQAGLPLSNRNKEVVSALLDANLSVDKQSIQKFLKIMHQFPDVDVKDLAFLQKHKIPINEANASMVKEYQNSEHRIAAQLTQLADRLVEVLQDGMEDGAGRKLLQQVLGKAGEGAAADEVKLEQPVQTEGSSTPKEETAQTSTSQAPEEMSAAEPMKQPAGLQEEVSLPAGENQQKAEEAGQESQRPALRDQYLPEQREALTQVLKEASFPPKVLEKVMSGEISAHELLNEVMELVEEQDSLSGEKGILHKLMASDELRQMLKDELLQNYTMTPKQLETPGTVKKYYEKLEHDLSQMTEVLKETASQETASRLAGQSEHLKENLDFMKALNQIYPYVQLPVRLKNQTVHSELYVFTKAKGKLQNADEISLLLHLDMDSIGPLDIHLKLHQKALKAKFYVQDQEVQELFESTIQELGSALEEKGYHLFPEFYQQEKPSAAFEEMMVQEQVSEGMTMKRYTFDVRA